MKTFKNLSELKAEKKRLRRRQEELEQSLRLHWQELKAGFSARPPEQDPQMAGGAEGGFWSSALDIGAGFIRRQVAAQAGKTAEARVDAGLELLTSRLKNWLQRRKRRR